MEDRQLTALPEIGQNIVIVFQGAPFGPDMDPNTKQMTMSLNTFKGVFRGTALEEAPDPVSITPSMASTLMTADFTIWFIGDPGGSVIWRVKRDQVLMWTPTPSLNQA